MCARKADAISILDGVDARERGRRRKLPAAMIAHQFKPGQVANPLGGRALPREKRDLYREARRIALDHAPEAMRRAVELMRSTDERVATVCVQIVLDRAGIRPVDEFDPKWFETEDPTGFRASDHTLEELEIIRDAARLIREARERRAASRARSGEAEAEILPPPRQQGRAADEC